MANLLIGHYTYRMFPPAIDIILTSLAVAYSIRKYTNIKSMSHYITYSPTHKQYSCFWWQAIEKQKTVAHQREEQEWLVGTVCKYNVLLGNLPLYYRMFPLAIDKLPKLTYIGGGGEWCVVKEATLRARPSRLPQVVCSAVQCRPPCLWGNGGRKHLRTTIRFGHINQIRDCSCSKLWRPPPPLHHVLWPWGDQILKNFCM